MYDDSNLKIYEKNNMVVIVNPYNDHWIRISSQNYRNMIEKKQEFYKLIDLKYGLFSQQYECNSIRTVYYSITGRCNLQCEFCTLNSGPNVSTKDDIPLSEIESNLLPKIAFFKPSLVVISGGEPTIRKDIKKILNIFSNQLKSTICLQTNGLLLNEKLLEDILQYIDIIEISIENIFEDCIIKDKMLKIFNYLKQKDINVKFSFVIDQHSKRYIKQAIDICKEYNAIFEFRLVSAVGRADGKDILLSQEDCIRLYTEMAQYVLDKEYFDEKITYPILGSLQTKRTCGGYGRTLGIHPNGNVYMCGNFNKNQFCYGNIKNLNINQIQNNIQKKLNEENIKKLFLVEENKICKQCEFKYFCGGPCAAESQNQLIEQLQFNCNFKKTLFDYLMFYHNKKNSIKENLKNLIKVLKIGFKEYEETYK